MRNSRASRAGALVVVPVLALAVAACGRTPEEATRADRPQVVNAPQTRSATSAPPAESAAPSAPAGSSEASPETSEASPEASEASPETSASAEPDPTGTAKEEAPTRMLTAAEIEAALPPQDEFPEGWSRDTDPSTDSLEVADDPACQPIINLLDITRHTRPPAHGLASGLAPDMSAMWAAELGSYEDVATARALLDQAREALPNCGTITTKDGEGTTARNTVAEVDFPAMEDGAFAVRIEKTVEGMTFTYSVVAVRAGHTVGSFAFITLDDSASADPNTPFVWKTMARVRNASEA